MAYRRKMPDDGKAGIQERRRRPKGESRYDAARFNVFPPPVPLGLLLGCKALHRRSLRENARIVTQKASEKRENFSAAAYYH